jgi:hypothetical protein
MLPEPHASNQVPELLPLAGLVPPVLEAVPLDCTPGSPGWQSGPRTPAACRLGFPELAAAAVALGNLYQHVGSRASII